MSKDSLPPLPTLPITSAETLRKCRQLPVGANDIFISSFPKSGTTWMQNIVFQLLAAERLAQKKKDNPSLGNEILEKIVDQEELPLKHISQYAPFYEIDPHWEEDSDRLVSKIREAHCRLGYRIFNTHLLWDMLPKSHSTKEEGRAKFIYVVRDGRDTLTSFYHHLTNQHPDDGGYEGTFESFFRDFLKGDIAYGKWHYHLASWMPHILGEENKRNPQILLVRYEDLKKNLRGQISRIAEFLELREINHGMDGEDSMLMSRVLERVDFSWMREHQELFHPISVRWKPGYNFIRNGTVGNHDAIFDDEHKKIFMESVEADLRERENGNLPDWLNAIGFHSTS